MRLLSGSLRIACGVGVLLMAGRAYAAASDVGGARVSLFGHALDLEPQTLRLLILGAGAIGVLLVLYGLVTLLRRARPEEASTR